jgi:hypothetical protein
MHTKLFRSAIVSSALCLAVTLRPALAQDTVPTVTAAATASDQAPNGLGLALACLGVVVFLAGRRSR